MSDITEVTQDSFESEVLKAATPVLVDFWAPWCGPCRAMAPVLESAAKQFSGKIAVVKVNIDDNPNLASKYGIHSIPTLFLFKNGEVADSLVGFVSEKDLAKKLEAHAS